VVLAALMTSSASFAQSGATPAPATVNQLMRGILFINSNVVFSAQSDDPAGITQDAQGSRAVNPLAGVFGGWQAIENAALALVESATLLEMPRACSNGKPAPVKDAEWRKFVEELRQVGMAAYKAGQAKSQDAILDVSDQMTQMCAHCHGMYRRGRDANAASRCTK
jgi:hypothetical protein